mgnify:CR=1 FL=1
MKINLNLNPIPNPNPPYTQLLACFQFQGEEDSEYSEFHQSQGFAGFQSLDLQVGASSNPKP